MAQPPPSNGDGSGHGELVPRASTRPYGTGTYRRAIRVRLDDDRACGELEDDFHHFRVEIRHDGRTVTEVDGSGIRSPWTMCLTAGEPLAAMTGTALRTGPLALSHLDARRNCTHMFDLAGLVVTHAARSVNGDRRYDMAVTDSAADGERTAHLWRDGEPVLDWRLRDRTVLGPAQWTEAPLWNGFIPWAAEHLDDETAEAAVALRRACDISHGRMKDLDELDTAEPLLDVMAGICHSFQPEHAPLAIRHKGSGRDFTDHADQLLVDFDSRNR
ncbi:MAG: hypothetical protein R2695_09725 [Acidimicrobiales bacterium]